jgi:hypothetical protein
LAFILNLILNFLILFSLVYVIDIRYDYNIPIPGETVIDESIKFHADFNSKFFEILIIFLGFILINF